MTENKVVTQDDLDNFPELLDYDVQVGDTVSWDYPDSGKGAHTDAGDPGDPTGTPHKPPVPPQ